MSRSSLLEGIRKSNTVTPEIEKEKSTTLNVDYIGVVSINPKTNGVLVTQVERNTGAFRSGLRDGMIIIEADRHDVNFPIELKRVLDRHKPGDSVLLRIRDWDGVESFIAIELQR